ncbi:MAG: GntR family transcriptional regulator [Lentisphaeria bacterium]|nr:GntR family transcriptional regulator [Lentisphaeria bacterium]
MTKKSNKEVVINFLTTQILKGELKPGMPLRELHIAKELSLSQAPVREALRQMEGGGLVQYKPRCGSSVKCYTSEELLATYDVREALESFALTRCGAVIFEPEQKARLTEILNDFKVVQTINQFSEVDYKFHNAIVELSNNPLYCAVWRRNMNRLQIATTVKQVKLNLKETIREHIEMGELLLEGKIEEVNSHLEQHYKQLRNNFNGELV